MTGVLVLIGGALGAVARASVDRAVTTRVGTDRPWGTLTVNTLGSLLLGMLVGATDAPLVRAGVGTGFLGAFTTFSTFAVQHVLLLRRHRPAAARMVAIGVAAPLAAAWLGLLLTA